MTGCCFPVSPAKNGFKAKLVQLAIDMMILKMQLVLLYILNKLF